MVATAIVALILLLLGLVVGGLLGVILISASIVFAALALRDLIA